MPSVKRRPEPGQPEPRTSATRVVAVPRRWLVTLGALVVLPWLVVAALYVAARGGADDAAPAVAGATEAVPHGPWGRLSKTPIVISPPLELVSTDSEPASGPRWALPGVSAEEFEAFLKSSGVAPADARAVRATARAEPRIAGVVAFPDPGFVARLTPDVRASLYEVLARSPLNEAQAHAYRFGGSTVENWFSGSLIAQTTRALVEPVVYRMNGYLYVADLDLIRSQVADEDELRRLTKTLLRQSTVLVQLTVHDRAEVPGLVDYWGRGGRRTDLRPLLESIAGGGPDRAIDIAHLLPSFAREHLYRYPKLSAADFDKPVIANCLWTSLNFFAAEPDDRFLDVNLALGALKSEYFVVENGFQLGDIMAFLDEEGDIFHVVVYLADDLVLTKNGTSPMAPWIILPLDEVKNYYSTRSRDMRLIVHRRNDL